MKPKIKANVRPSQYLDYRLYFEGLFKELKSSKESYSYQTFAEELGFSASSIMHQIVKAYRPLTDKSLRRILKHLDLPAAERKYLIYLIAFCNAKNSGEKEAAFEGMKESAARSIPEEMEKYQLQYFSHWLHPVIWEMIGCSYFISDVNWIVERLRIKVTPEEVLESLSLLESLGLIRLEDGKWQQTQDRVVTPPRVKGLSLVSYHLNMLDHAKLALTDVKGSQRDFSSSTVSLSEESFEKLRGMIHDFQVALLDEANRSTKTEKVYQINIQLFPFTRN